MSSKRPSANGWDMIGRSGREAPRLSVTPEIPGYFPLAAGCLIRWRDSMLWKKGGKVLVVSSSLMLGCGYVIYRHQEQAKEPAGEKAVLPGSKNPMRVTLLPSSKNIDSILTKPSVEGKSGDFSNPLPPLEIPAEKQTERALLPGSKIGAIIKKEDAEAINRNKMDAVLDSLQSTPPETEPPQ